MKRFKEPNLYPLISKYFQNKDFYTLTNFRPFEKSYSRVDILAVDKTLSKIISVEVKLNNFSKALKQAIARSFFSDYVYLAFPSKYAKTVLNKYSQILNCTNIGILSINKYVSELKPPGPSPLLIPDLKNLILTTIKRKVSITDKCG